MGKNKKKNIVYSTNPNFDYNIEDEGFDTIENDKQKLKVLIDRKQRKGKSVTLITGFIGKPEDIKDLAKVLKSKCGVGGSVKNSEILVQGDFKIKIHALLIDMGYSGTKKVG